jgi:hypothetical protein
LGSNQGQTGTVTGSLNTFTNLPITSGSFGFNVNLSTGKISDGFITHTVTMSGPTSFIDGGPYTTTPGDTLSINLSGLSGTADSFGFIMGSTSPIAMSGSNSITFSGWLNHSMSNAKVDVSGPSVDLRTLPSGSSFPATYSIGDSGSNILDSGTGSGTIIRR